MKIMRKRFGLLTLAVGGILAGLALLVGPGLSTAAAQDVDARWLPWLGCWEAAEAGEDVPLLCVRPSTQAEGVEFVTWSAGEITSTETIRADGLPRDAERGECRGLEEARFSADGHRVYLESTYVCEGGVERGTSGILAMVNPMEWVDIKSVDGSPWVLRYRLARASRVQEAGMENVVASRAAQVKAARIAASSRLTEDDIIEAAGNVDGQAVEALIVERGDPFAVNADMLIRLDDAGVPAGVIDLVVAVSHPDKFAVKSGPMPVEEYEDDFGAARPIYMGGGFYDPWWGGSWYGYSPFYFGYSRYGYGLGYPYGYGGYYGYGYPYYRTTPIVVEPRTGGRMVRGQGYTRGSSGSAGYTGRSARPRGSSAGSGGVSRSPSTPTVRSGGGVSTGRTAKPRTGGGGSVARTSGSSGGGSVARTSGSSGGGSVQRTAKPRTGGGGGL
jgi:hypothetical protein